MTPASQRRIQRYGWDNAAGYYAPFWQEQLKPAQDRLLEMAALQPGEHVLEVACGSGLVTFPAAEAVARAWRKFDDATRAAANEKYLASIEPYRNGDGYAIPGEFVVASGQRTDST